MAIITMGLDLAKSLFVARGVDAFGAATLVHPVSHARPSGSDGQTATTLQAPGGDGDARPGAQRLPSVASTAAASASSTQGVTAIGSRSAHCA